MIPTADLLAQQAMELPKDIICIIMAKLPVKSLMRFEIVSNAWYNLIRDRRFRQSYTNNCVSQSSKSFILLRKDELYFADKQDHGWKKNAAFTLNSRLLSDLNLIIVSTCNGFLCLADLWGYAIGFNIRKTRIIIYNPITREGAMLPELGVEWNPITQRPIGINFGYDAKTNKYKVAIMCSRMIHIITVGEKSWRKLDDSLTETGFSSSPPLTVSSNKEFFWFVESSRKILIMDISNEKLRGIEMNEIGSMHVCSFFFVHGKYVTVIATTTPQDLDFGRRMHVWELIDSRNGIWKRQETHDKIFKQEVDVIGTAGGDHLLLKLLPPYGSSSTEPPNEFVIYHPKSGEVSSLSSPDDPKTYDVFYFVPTLASLKF